MIQAQTELGKVRAESAQAQEEGAEIDRLVANGEPNDSIPAIAQNPTVQRIKQEIDIENANLAAFLKKYAQKYPTVIAARSRIKQLEDNLQQECENQLKTIHNRATLLRKDEEKLTGFVKAEEKRQLELNALKIQYDMLKSDAVNNKAVYSNVLVRMKETELMSRMNSNNMRVVDEAAEPIRPVKPRTTLTILGGIIGGMLVAIGLAFFVNYLDDSLKSQDDIETHLRVPFLGYIPNIKTNSVVERDLQAHLHPQSNAAEGFRTIRATISLTHKPEKFRVLAITSTIPFGRKISRRFESRDRSCSDGFCEPSSWTRTCDVLRCTRRINFTVRMVCQLTSPRNQMISTVWFTRRKFRISMSFVVAPFRRTPPN